MQAKRLLSKLRSAALLVDEVLPEQPIRQWVLSFPFQLRFLFASRPQLMGRILGIVYRVISAQLIQKVGFTRKTAQTGAVTLIQRFGSALNLNVHFHMLFLDGVYTITPWGKSRFHRTNAPAQRELTELVHTISHRVAGYLERQGILERDEENSYLNLEEGDEDPMQQVLGCSVSYRIAIGPQQGRNPSLYDVILDLLGIAAGGILYTGFIRRSLAPHLSIGIVLLLALSAFAHGTLPIRSGPISFPF
ncbi:MAG: transposase [Candidatus Thiodiazotropha sp. (ex Lucina pensylvanica)]|nr:transposase [Candidatus Thiodiazotropha sp. (ex Lucina pensylvanica)]MBT3050933.1 transposase [Candidatus Thiodiazotropha sp. (ex Codakia orbicularis)]